MKIHTKEWNKNIWDNEWVIKKCRNKFYKYASNTTYKWLDFCAWWNTINEAETNLRNYLLNK